ncbi:MAG: hypothetical protein IKV59_02015 [Lachnospiraceae bacterium]|nr:hypothetical protein [Lachnospiraceae bacterium]MBR5508811.1 hypothetical protein [Lachnospiraceae bacterium]
MADDVAGGRHSLGGSMTLEAAVVIPMLLFFFLNLMSAIEMVRFHGNLELALWKNGRIMAVSGYAYDKIFGEGESEVTADAMWEEVVLELGVTLLSDLAVRNAVVCDLGRDYLEKSPLTYGEKGLVFLESSYGEDDYIDVKVTYQVSPMFCIPGFKSFRMANRYYARAWTGYAVGKVGGEQGSEAVLDRVYVTPYGEVYHMSRDCSYLKRIISVMSLSEVYSARNSSGERYVLCRVCAGQGVRIVYVTRDGSSYHEKKDCPSLKRTIITLERLAAEAEYRPCSKCAK